MANNLTAFASLAREALAEKKFDNLHEMIRDDVVLYSPRHHKPVRSKAHVMGIVQNLPKVIEGVKYHREWTNEDAREVVLEFKGQVAGLEVNGIDIFTLDDAGRVAELTVFLRPTNAMMAVGEKEDAALAEMGFVGKAKS